MDMQVFVRGLILHSHHGITLEEQEAGQRLHVDIRCTVSETASRSDAMGETVDYVALASLFELISAEKRCFTLEHVAQRYVTACLERFDRIRDIEVTIGKPHPMTPLEIAMVGVTLRGFSSRSFNQGENGT